MPALLWWFALPSAGASEWIDFFREVENRNIRVRYDAGDREDLGLDIARNEPVDFTLQLDDGTPLSARTDDAGTGWRQRRTVVDLGALDASQGRKLAKTLFRVGISTGLMDTMQEPLPWDYASSEHE